MKPYPIILLAFVTSLFSISQRCKSQHKVTVSSHQTNGQVEILVRDNGIGMPDTVKIKIFQPFFTTKAAGQGTGLGLSLSYDIVTKGHGGELTVQSQEGEFTKLVIVLPLHVSSFFSPIPPADKASMKT